MLKQLLTANITAAKKYQNRKSFFLLFAAFSMSTRTYCSLKSEFTLTTAKEEEKRDLLLRCCSSSIIGSDVFKMFFVISYFFFDAKRPYLKLSVQPFNSNKKYQKVSKYNENLKFYHGRQSKKMFLLH